jgi:DeoD family purine-nucleoside phosphorylase
VEASSASLTPPPIHLHPAAPLAERVLLPGDPARALLLARSLLEKPLMFNHNRGLWGYTGQAPDGRPLTIQSTGMGGPSAAIVIAELANLGVRTLIRVGTCGALAAELALGDLVVVTEALSFDGTSGVLARDARLLPDPGLCDLLAASALARDHRGPVASTDLFYDGPPGEEERWREAGALAVEMETATLFALAGRRLLRAASVLLVSDLLAPSRARIDDEALQEGERRLGQAAAEALSQI